MNYAMVSFIIEGNEKIGHGNVELVSNLVNQLIGEDLILFSGWTLSNKKDVDNVLKRVNNKHTTFVLEIGNGLDGKNSDSGFYIVKGNTILRGPIKQRFTDSATANSNKDCLLQNYLEVLKSERLFKVGSKKVRLIICGENNILRNKQKQGNKVAFRSYDNDLQKRFNSILKDTDVFLNPAHTPMGNIGKLKKRWAYLSEGGRSSLFTTNECVKPTSKGNAKKGTPNLDKISLQYIFINGEERNRDCKVYDKYRISKIEIE